MDLGVAAAKCSGLVGCYVCYVEEHWVLWAIYRRSTVALILHILVFDVSGKVRAVTNKSDRQTTNSLTLLTQHNVPMLRSVINIVTILLNLLLTNDGNKLLQGCLCYEHIEDELTYSTPLSAASKRE